MSMKRKRSPLITIKPEPLRSQTPAKRVKMEVVLTPLRSLYQRPKRSVSHQAAPSDTGPPNTLDGAHAKREDFVTGDHAGTTGSQFVDSGANVDELPSFDLTGGHPSLPSVVPPRSEVQSTRQSSRRSPARSNVRAKSELDDKANVQAPDSNRSSGTARPSVSPQEARRLARAYGAIPKIKKDSEVDDDTYADIISRVGIDPYDVTLDPDIRFVKVTRMFMSKHYGGSPQTMNACRTSGLTRWRNFLFLNVANGHPNGPWTPGYNGVMFHEKVFDRNPYSGSHNLFINLGNSRWLYAGLYEVSLAPPLPPARWAIQSHKLKSWWANGILSWGHPHVKADIVIRRDHGRKPIAQEYEDATARKYTNLTAQNVLRAFNTGEQRLGVFTLKCVCYDEELQRDIASRSPEEWYVAYRKEEKRKNEAKKAAQAEEVDSGGEQGRASVQSKGKVVKRKPAKNDGGKGKATTKNVTEEESDDDEIPIVPRGTKSRPRPSSS